jgi:hypothetical protein
VSNALMRRPTFGSASFILVGAAAFLLLHLQFALWWESYYSHFPVDGYQAAMAAHRVPPFFASSERSLLVARLVLAVLPLLALPFAGVTPWKAVWAMWGGVMVAVVFIWVATPALRQDSNMWPIDLVFLAVMTGIPLVLGMFAYLLVISVRRQMESP